MWTTSRRPARSLLTRPAFEDGDALLDRREAHRVVAGDFDDALLGRDRAAHDVAPGVIGEGAKHVVEVGRRDLHQI